MRGEKMEQCLICGVYPPEEGGEVCKGGLWNIYNFAIDSVANEVASEVEISRDTAEKILIKAVKDNGEEYEE